VSKRGDIIRQIKAKIARNQAIAKIFNAEMAGYVGQEAHSWIVRGALHV
jgi:hypothetical protein